MQCLKQGSAEGRGRRAGRRAQGIRQATGADDGVYRIGDIMEVDVEFESEAERKGN